MERAVDWESLFSRSSGWTGADGIYWILLSGNESPGNATNGRTLFVFSDTFIGEMNDSGERLPGSTLVHSILAGLAGDEPDPAKIILAEGRPGKYRSCICTDTSGTKPRDWYWMMDAISLNGKMHLFGLRMELGDGGLFNFAVAVVALLSVPLDSPNPGLDVVRVDTPREQFYIPP